MRGHLFLLLALLGAGLVGLVVWSFLPPTAHDERLMREAIAAYESADVVAWPPRHAGRETLPRSEADALRQARRASLQAVAESTALREALAYDPVRAMLAERHRDPAKVVVSGGATVVLFDFRRRDLRGHARVQAAVLHWRETGTWDPRRRSVVGVERRHEGTCQVFDYRLRQTGDTWRVLEAHPLDHGLGFYDPGSGQRVSGP